MLIKFGEFLAIRPEICWILHIYKFDISNGPGIRVSLFVQGCPFHCPGCFNPETWDFKGGKKYDHEINNYLMSLCDHDYISGLSILGGEPLDVHNASTVLLICQQFKKLYPNKTIWIWTGNDFTDNEWQLRNARIDENYYHSFKEVLDKYVDAIIDGPFIEAKKDLSLQWRGSSNQRIWMKNENGEWYDASNNFR